MSKTKKPFINEDNPVYNLISQTSLDVPDLPDQIPAIDPAPAAQPAPIHAPAKPETKTKRLQLVIRPSLYQAAKEKAAAHGISVNELVNQAIEAIVKGE